jgi:hypothetical protein
VDFLDVLWSIIVIYFLIAILIALFAVITDVFRDDDLSGWGKGAWLIFLIVFPLIGLVAYVVTRHRGMSERRAARQAEAEREFATHVRNVAGAQSGPASEIAQAKALLDGGAISQAEFDAIKTKALA